MKFKVAAIVLAAGHRAVWAHSNRCFLSEIAPSLNAASTIFAKPAVNEIVVVVGHRADEVREHLKDPNVTFALNQIRPAK